MKIKIKEFEHLAKRKGYANGNTLFKELGGGKYAYKHIKFGFRVGYEIVKEFFNRFGIQNVNTVIDMEGETIEGLKSKYVQIGNRLY